jgi:hypothetical protein
VDFLNGVRVVPLLLAVQGVMMDGTMETNQRKNTQVDIFVEFRYDLFIRFSKLAREWYHCVLEVRGWMEMGTILD